MNRLIILLALVGALRVWADGPSSANPWSFSPLQPQPLPKTEREDWIQTRLDAFILARLEATGLAPSPAADPRRLQRRLSFDLIGLPPSPAQWESFRARAQINLATAVHEEIDRLLASPHYGERWARHWLDLARYTDKTASWLKLSDVAWRYRDWVVSALNRDLSYPEFVIQQLANDLIEGGDPRDNAALGFLGLSPTYWKELQLPPEVIKTTVADEWEERMDAVGRTFLGLTLGCARCHDHKTDPITQRDYYAIAGVFASTRIADRPMMKARRWAPIQTARQTVAGLEEQRVKLENKVKANDLSKDERSAIETRITGLSRDILKIKTSTPDYHAPTVNGVLDSALYVEPADGGHGTKLVLQDRQARDLHLHRRGNPNRPGALVPRRFLGVFPGHSDQPRRLTSGSGRLELAQAIVTEAAPLSSRVIVNRIWQHHFGRGLVTTPSELGHSGEPPSHPQLLDDLAYRFVEHGWSLKWLHREILASATWQQGNDNPRSHQLDPNNLSLARMDAQRLEIEAWRDAMLLVTGTFDSRTGGPSVDLSDSKNARRTIYGTVHRRDLSQILRVHDFPDPTAHSPKRTPTLTALQQLFSLNAPFLHERAAALADRLIKSALATEQRIEWGYRHLFQRVPTDAEMQLALRFLDSATDSREAWIQYAHSLLAGNEFLFIE